MKITLGQLKQLIREQVEEARRKPAMSPKEIADFWKRHDEAVAARPAEIMKQLKAEYPKAYQKVKKDGMEKELLKNLKGAHEAELHNGGGTLTLKIGTSVLKSLVGDGYGLPSYKSGPVDIYGYPISAYRNESEPTEDEPVRGGEVWALYSLSDGARNYFGLASGDSKRNAIINAGKDPDARGYEEVKAELYDPETHDLALRSMNLTDRDVQKVASGEADFIRRKQRKTYSGPRDIYGYPTGRGRKG